MLNENELVRMVLRCKTGSIPMALDAVRRYATDAGFDSTDILRLETAVEEACLNVVHHAFDSPDTGEFSLHIERHPGALHVIVADQGLPYDFAGHRDTGAGIGMRLIRALTDETRFEYLGKAGKRVVLVKMLPDQTVEPYIEEEISDAAAKQLDARELNVSIRTMLPDESIDVARCLYRSYGYTYAADLLYYPDRLRERIECGLLRPCVATNPDGVIAGYLAVMLNSLDAKVAETGQAVVDPRFRGQGIFERMKEFAVSEARGAGLYGVYSESVTIHPYTQKGNHALGARETGLLLGYVPDAMQFQKFAGIGERQAVVLFYLRLNTEPLRTVYPPLHHSGIIKKIYAQGGFKRTCMDGDPGDVMPVTQANSALTVAVRDEWSQAIITISEFGSDAVAAVRAHISELRLRRIDCIYLDLPLGNYATAALCAEFEMLGFFFGGMIPEYCNGDVLRLQLLNNVRVTPERITVHSDFGRELLEYVLHEMGKA
jgi:serine/threonine-protein kinase RsbW